MKLDLVDGRRDLETRIGEQFLEILDGEVGDTDVLHTAGLRKLLQLSPCVFEVPVGVVLLQIIGVGRRRPVLNLD